MSRTLSGIHHITAIAGDAQANLDFYVGVLGLRRVKTTVNYDDPQTHHLYYGDAVGTPGTILTFFPWPRAGQGRTGAGMVSRIAFAVPEGTLDAWAGRLSDAGIEVERTGRFGLPTLHFEDPSGQALALVATAAPGTDALWADGPVPAAEAIRGFHAPTLPIFSDDRTPELLTDLFGWEEAGTEGDCLRLRAPEDGPGSVLDLQRRDRHPSGRLGPGTVHHIAFRAEDAAAQQHWQAALRERGIQVTDVKDRQYFQSIYFRDPDWTSGLLFEIATDGPGFLTDEGQATLGTALRLPEWLQGRRQQIRSALPTLTSPLDGDR